jgi:dienelactone hydrolase
MNALALAVCLAVAQPGTDLLAEAIRSPNVYAPGSDQAKAAGRQIGRWLDREQERVNLEDVAAWRKIDSKEAWDASVAVRIANLKKSLGTFPPIPDSVPVHVTRTLTGEGFKIDNLVYESRPGLWVTANLYRPDPLPKSAPALLIAPAHHNPKTQGELQDMGMQWARTGCYVLVPDMLGHGERRQHPFNVDADWPTPYKTGRQDYYFRYDLGLELQLTGESLIGWDAHDLMTGVSLLLAKPAVDPKRIVLLGSVAGGGDIAAVAAALDKRITCLVPFNFGGPQPETKFPLPDDAETAFNYMGGGSWESTRNLFQSGPGGFLPWAIVGSVLPRYIVHAHEFKWDEARDPVWKRYQKIAGFYGVADHLAVTHGSGSVKGKPPESTHCNNIGPPHRVALDEALNKWFDIPGTNHKFQNRFKSEELRCWTPELRDKLKPKAVHEILAAAGLPKRTTPPKVDTAGWTNDLGRPKDGDDMLIMTMKVRDPATELETVALWLEPHGWTGAVVFGFGSKGKKGFLDARKAELVGLLVAKIAVCLVDVPGTGETAYGDGRGKSSANTSYSSTAQMLGTTLDAPRVAGLLALVARVEEFAKKNGHKLRIGLWGDTDAAINPATAKLEVPHDVEPYPAIADPLGARLALEAGLAREVRAVFARGGIANIRSVFESPFLYVPHDAIATPLDGQAALAEFAAKGKTSVRLERFVDSRNRVAPESALGRGTDRITASAEPSAAADVVAWFVKALE